MDATNLVRLEREKLHHLIDSLPDPQTFHRLIAELPPQHLMHVEFALRTLCSLTDPVQRALDATLPDDEPVTPEERQAIQQAEEELLQHPPHLRTFEEVRQELGL